MMKNVFDSILKTKPSELEYLKLLLESEFPQLLAEKISAHGSCPRLVTVNVSYIDKSPRLSPEKPWPFNSGVEFGDILFGIKYEYLQKRGQDRPIEVQKDENRSRAFVFQSKKTKTESGESTKKQEFLYRSWPPFSVSVPHEIRDHCNTPSNLFEPSDQIGKSIKKSGLWIINSSTPPMPEIIITDSADESKDLTFSLDKFLSELVNNKYEVGKKFYESGTDDWSRLINAVLNYTKRKKLRKSSGANSLYKTVSKNMRADFIQSLPNYYLQNASTVEYFDSEKSNWFFSLITNIFFRPSKPFWLVEITITDIEFGFRKYI